MFDVGFSEMMVIAVVALVVIGPERLPRVARTLGHLFGRMQRYVNDVKADINREIELDELRKFKDQFQEAKQSVENSIHGGLDTAKAEVQEVENLVSSADQGQATQATQATIASPQAAEPATELAASPSAGLSAGNAPPNKPAM
jgi:sec-independent protein translocase protein TatB